MTTTSKKEERLTRKIKRLLRQGGTPRWLHHFGPKTYELWQHVFAFVVMTTCRLSLRRVEKFLSLLFGIDVGYKTVERFYSDDEVEMALHNMLVLTLKKKNVKKIHSCGDAIRYSLARQHYWKGFYPSRESLLLYHISIVQLVLQSLRKS